MPKLLEASKSFPAPEPVMRFFPDEFYCPECLAAAVFVDHKPMCPVCRRRELFVIFSTHGSLFKTPCWPKRPRVTTH